MEWLGQVEVIKNQLQKDPQSPRAILMQTLNVKKGRLSYLYKINACFDQQALNRVRQAAQSTPPAFVPFGNARALAVLGDKIPKPYEPVHEALEVVISNQLTLPQIEALVDHIASGKPAKDFVPNQAKTDSTPVGRSPLTDSTTQPQVVSTEPVEDTNPGNDAEDFFGLSGPNVPPRINEIRSKVKAGQRVGVKDGMHLVSHMLASGIIKFLGGFTGISHKDLESQNLGKKTRKGLFWLIKRAWWLLRWLFKHVWHLLMAVIKEPFKLIWVLIGGYVKSGLGLALLLVLIYGIYLYRHDRKEFWSDVDVIKNWSLQTAEKQIKNEKWTMKNEKSKTPTITATVQNSNEKLTTPTITSAVQIQNPAKPESDQEIVHSPLSIIHSAAPGELAKPKSHPGIVHSPLSIIHSAAGGFAKPWKAEDEDYDFLSEEIYPIPESCVIKSLKPALAGDISGKKAESYLADLQDAGKYSMWLGKEKMSVLKVELVPNGVILHTQDPQESGLKVSFDWVELTAIHCDKLQVFPPGDIPGQTIYQCGLVIPPFKKAITIECSSVENLRRLLSALEYWIKSAKGGEKAPITGLPYLHQGVLFTEKSGAAVLWVGSPVEKAGLRLGDVVWSLDKANSSKMKSFDLEKALNKLTAGKHDLDVLPGGKEGPRKKIEMLVQ